MQNLNTKLDLKPKNLSAGKSFDSKQNVLPAEKKLDSRPKVLPIKKIVKETENIWTFVFDYSEFNHLGERSKPGQFVMLWIPGVDEKPFSIAYDDGREFWLTIAKVGHATEQLFKLKAGDLVGVRGPFGTWYEFESGEHLALLAGGYGAAPMYNVARAALEVGCTVEFIVGARSKNLLLYEGRVKELAKKYNGRKGGTRGGAVGGGRGGVGGGLGGGAIFYHAATDDGSAGYKGYNTEVLAKILNGKLGGGVVGGAGGKIDRVFACGPEIMMKKAAEMAVKKRKKCQVSLERYMKCGFGVCGQCCMDDSGICVCKNGPVYDGAAALKLREFGRYHRDGVGRRVVR